MLNDFWAEIARINYEFEKTTSTSLLKAPRTVIWLSIVLMKDIQSVIDSFEELVNPFMEQGNDLLITDTRDIINNNVVEVVKNVDKIGQEQYSSYVECM